MSIKAGDFVVVRAQSKITNPRLEPSLLRDYGNPPWYVHEIRENNRIVVGLADPAKGARTDVAAVHFEVVT